MCGASGSRSCCGSVPSRGSSSTMRPHEYEADAVVITTPVPQAYSFLIAGELDAPDGLRELTYERTLALLVVLDGPSAVPEPGGVQDADATFSFVADNARKGVSALPALTLHVRSNLSETWWDDDPSATVTRLIDSAPAVDRRRGRGGSTAKAVALRDTLRHVARPVPPARGRSRPGGVGRRRRSPGQRSSDRMWRVRCVRGRPPRRVLAQPVTESTSA